MRRRRQAAVEAYRSLAGRLADEGLAASAEMSVKLSAVGQALDELHGARQRARRSAPRRAPRVLR